LKDNAVLFKIIVSWSSLLLRKYFEVAISPEKNISRREKEHCSSLYSSAHTLCGVYG